MYMPDSCILDVQKEKLWNVRIRGQSGPGTSFARGWRPLEVGQEEEERERQRNPLLKCLEWAWDYDDDDCPYDLKEVVNYL